MKRLFVILCDSLGIVCALFIAAAVRFDGDIPLSELVLIALTVPAVLTGKILAILLFQCDKWSFRYAGSSELRRLLAAISLGTLLGWAFTYLVGPSGTSRAVLLLEPLFSLFILGAFRFGLRVLPDKLPSLTEDSFSRRKVIIIGAGDAGVMTLREIHSNPHSDMIVAGFIDDDPKKKGLWIDGVRVIGGREEIPDAVKSLNIDELLIAIPSASGENVREIIAACRDVKIKFRVVPGLLSIIKGSVAYSRIREIKPEDLLGRETTEIKLELFKDKVVGKKILVTGAGGSIGSELSRQLHSAGADIVLLDHSETALYLIDSELRSRNTTNITSYIADVRNRRRIEEIISNEKPEMVFHAAAYKHVPLMENNIYEAVSVNIVGTMNVSELSKIYGVKLFTFISTDKAVRPTSVMGAAKRAAEQWIFSINWSDKKSDMKIAAVRFGNVFGSSGSAPLLFKKQIEAGGPVTVTHPHVIRYFMTISEAVFLVINASLLTERRDLFVLEMGQPIRILDLAKNMITLSGFRPEIDIPIKFVGLRQGEKLYEEVLTDDEDAEPTKVKKIFRISKYESISEEQILLYNQLPQLIKSGEKDLFELLKKLVPDYKPER